MKSVIIISIIFSILFTSTIPDADAKTWKVHVLDMPKHWESHFGNIYHESTSYWEKHYPGTNFIQESNREKADFVVQWSSQFQGTKLGYYTPSSNNDFGRPFIAITMGFMDDESVKFQDRKFNLVDAEYAKLITIHELGHAIGFGHSDDKNDIMYPSLYDYDYWLSQKQLDGITTKESTEITTQDNSKLSEIITQYNSKSLEIQKQANSNVEEVKTYVFSKQELLLSKQYENPDAQAKLDQAWNYLEEAKNHLNQAEWTQKEGEDYLKLADYEKAYFKYLNSVGMAKNVWNPISDLSKEIESAEKLESEYQSQETKKIQKSKIQKEEKTCFWFFCW